MLRDVNSLVEQTWTNNILNFWAKIRWGLAQVGNGSLVMKAAPSSSSLSEFDNWKKLNWHGPIEDAEKMYKIALSHKVIQCYKAFQMYLRTRKRTVEGSNGFELMLLHGSSRCCLAHSESCRHRDPHVTKVERNCAAWPAIINLLTFCCVLKSKNITRICRSPVVLPESVSIRK